MKLFLIRILPALLLLVTAGIFLASRTGAAPTISPGHTTVASLQAGQPPASFASGPAVPLDFIELNRNPAPPNCVQPGGVESFNWTITFSSIPDHYVYSITNPLNNVVYGPFTVNIQGQPSPVTGSDAWPVPTNALPGNYGISIYYYSNFGLEATARVIFIVCNPATTTSTHTNTPTNVPSYTPTNTPTNVPTDTPSDTPTNTPTDTPTNTPTDTPTSTFTPTRTPTRTPTLPPCNVCNLSVTQVTIACNPDGTVHWTATIYNRGTCIVADNYVASLQTKMPSGQFQTVKTQSGSRYFYPGSTTLSGDICYVFTSSNNSMRMQVDLPTNGARCTISNKSNSSTPCNRTQPCTLSSPSSP